MTDAIYKRDPVSGKCLDVPKKPGQVLHWIEEDGEAVYFECKCGKRDVYVRSPPHTISFNPDNILTITASCLTTGYKRGIDGEFLCHFFMTNGKIEMCGDSTCPGADR